MDQQEAADEGIAHLVLAAQEDRVFRRKVISLLRLPLRDREPLIRTALHEMSLRGEDPAIRSAFAALITEETALAVLRSIRRDETC